MSDFKYNQRAVSFDNRLAEVLESCKVAEPERDPLSFGLMGYVTKSTIAEEIDGLQKQATDLKVELAREQMQEIAASHAPTGFDSFLSSVKEASARFTDEQQEASELEQARQSLQKVATITVRP